MRPVFGILLGLGIAGGFAIWAVIVFAFFVTIDAGPHSVSNRNVTAAMESTLLSGEYFTSRQLLEDVPVSRGSLVDFLFPVDTSKRFVKRVVGVPGDTLAMHGGRLFVDGHPLVEQYAWHSDSNVVPGVSTAMAADFVWQDAFTAKGRRAYHPSRNDWGPLIVPASRYFVLGDNRDNSLDSRYFGFVERDQIYAIPRRVYFSMDPKDHRIRWSRFGAVLH